MNQQQRDQITDAVLPYGESYGSTAIHLGALAEDIRLMAEAQGWRL